MRARAPPHTNHLCRTWTARVRYRVIPNNRRSPSPQFDSRCRGHHVTPYVCSAFTHDMPDNPTRVISGRVGLGMPAYLDGAELSYPFSFSFSCSSSPPTSLLRSGNASVAKLGAGTVKACFAAVVTTLVECSKLNQTSDGIG